MDDIEAQRHARDQHLQALRRSIGKKAREDAAVRDTKYRDRARERKLNPFVEFDDLAPPPPLEQKPAVGNVGLKLLMSMGWKEGEGLGRGGQGMKEAIQVKRRAAREGLGAEDLDEVATKRPR
eukprot:TRINITY_DN855_c0_g1_i3.p2 TRINITY_DN855_c0_g1~~TRINITY_DN855_c0_g1_i3.p2  ORF type:complete len:123 (+),score=34.26 TRINITY_DN855_c0_g1_i3:685-1053(+)